MGHVDDLLGDVDVIVPVGWRLAVGLQRAVHHDRGKAGLDRGHAGGRLVAVIQMHANGDVRIHFHDSIHHVLQHDVIGILARTAGCLDDDRRVDGIGRGHDGQRLFHVVDVESGHAVVVFGCVVE